MQQFNDAVEGEDGEPLQGEARDLYLLNQRQQFINYHSFSLFRCYCQSFENSSHHMDAKSIKEMVKLLKVSAGVHIAIKLCKQHQDGKDREN
jgi:hypothetical protein